MKYHVSIVFHQVSPQSGLLEGGTLVTITGTNLGFRVDQVSNITVAGVPCTVVDYDVSTTLVSCTSCTTGLVRAETYAEGVGVEF